MDMAAIVFPSACSLARIVAQDAAAVEGHGSNRHQNRNQSRIYVSVRYF
jgi:hypothetical protein